MSLDLPAAFAEHRPALLRHCYRLVGSYAEAEDLLQDGLERAFRARDSYRGDAPFKSWLFAIVTNTCLNALVRRRKLSLPSLDSDPSGRDFKIGQREPGRFITPAPDARLFPNPEELSESRETLALAFVALLQRVPPKPRAVLLMKDVLGWSADEISAALGLSLSTVNSALHRARATVRRAPPLREEPAPATLQLFVRAWESRDLDGLIALLRDDIELSMPPYALWFRGADAVVAFFRSPGFAAFWAEGVRLVSTRACGGPAFAFYRDASAAAAAHSIMVAGWRAGLVAELHVFLDPELFPDFDLPLTLERTVSALPIVMSGGADQQ